jgi:hypothetical protein
MRFLMEPFWSRTFDAKRVMLRHPAVPESTHPRRLLKRGRWCANFRLISSVNQSGANLPNRGTSEMIPQYWTLLC